MFRFFRQIRQRLLSENRLSKYLLYSLGEILLVVIGILIALQINNWNEEEKARKQSNVFREKLVQDVIQDTLKINEILEDRRRIEKDIEAYFKFFDSGGNETGTLIDSARRVRWALFRYIPQNYTLRDMQATGTTSLLTERERKDLIELANTQDFLIQIIEKQIDEILEELHKRDAYLGDHMSESDFFETLNAPLTPAEARKGLLHQHNAFTEIVELGEIMETFAVSIKEKSKSLILLLKQN